MTESDLPSAGVKPTSGKKRQTPRLWFVDFPHTESIEDLESKNPLYKALQSRFDLQLDPANPEYLLCSTYGHRHYRYDCTKVLHVDENIFPDFRTYDWAFSYDPTKGRNFRLPAWAIKMGDPSSLLAPVEDLTGLLKRKEGVCAPVSPILANSLAGGVQRSRFIRALAAKMGTAAPRTISESIVRCPSSPDGLLDLYARYKFAIAFEEDSSLGYTTEKILAPLLGGSVPIYWGNPNVAREFNPGAFINAHNFSSPEELANYVLEVAADDSLYQQYLSAPPFTGNALPEDGDWEILAKRFERIFSMRVEPISSRIQALRGYQVLIPSVLSRQLWRRRMRKMKRPPNRCHNPTIDVGQADIPDIIYCRRTKSNAGIKKQSPKVWFVDFWGEKLCFSIEDALSKRFDLQLDPINPEFLLCGCHGREHTRYACTKVIFMQENYFPDFRFYDWSFSFDPTEGRNFRLPLWATQMGDPSALLQNPEDSAEIPKKKERFCAFVYTNPKCEQRNEFFRILSAKKQVDAAGRLFNNTDGLSDRYGVSAFDDLPRFYSRYKFTIAFENTSAPGYTTEKIVAPLLGRSVPIYWGNPEIAKEFNPEAFINAHDYGSLEELAEYVLKVDANDNLYLRYLRAPKFVGNKLPKDADWEVLADRMKLVFAEKVIPVSKSGFNRHFLQTHAFLLRKIDKAIHNKQKLWRPSHRKNNPTIRNSKNLRN